MKNSASLAISGFGFLFVLCGCTTSSGPIIQGAADGPSVIRNEPRNDWYDESLGAAPRWSNFDSTQTTNELREYGTNLRFVPESTREELTADRGVDLADERMDQLETAIFLSAVQKKEIRPVMEAEMAAEHALPPIAPLFLPDNLAQHRIVTMSALEKISGFLTPAQQTQFHRLPQFQGGGRVMGRLPENRLAHLDHVAHLTPGQAAAALAIFQDAYDAQTNIIYAAHGGPAVAPQMRAINLAMRTKILALLTPEQRKAAHPPPSAST